MRGLTCKDNDPSSVLSLRGGARRRRSRVGEASRSCTVHSGGGNGPRRFADGRGGFAYNLQPARAIAQGAPQ
eukprot:2987101-Alexandrium_andersonii.AAC.1